MDAVPAIPRVATGSVGHTTGAPRARDRAGCGVAGWDRYPEQVEPTNRLAGSTSPYLLQHADNPVAWQPWDDEALHLAATLDRPLLISIGYSSCHWCHVMAHESFEDPAIAALTNRAFVPIKIDREERPDLDSLYMAATQAATGHGGWPMTVFATPDGRPFYAGTYFPPVDRGGQPGFTRVLEALADAWKTQRASVETQADELARAVASEARLADRLAADLPAGDLDLAPCLDRLVGELAQRFDDVDGGFSPAPKFPRPSYVMVCLASARVTGDQPTLEMAMDTLRAMACGGIYDHLAGGFARYAVDTRWLVPHFEKMLTDQALLVPAYLAAFQLTGDDSCRQVVTETLDWVLDELLLPHGGLSASVDADAAGHEGSHAVFRPDEVAAALDDNALALDAEEACTFFGITTEGTFERGASVIARRRGSLRRTEAEEATRRALLAVRRTRPQPSIDDKVLTEWNAMMACTLAEAAGVLGVERWAAAARQIIALLDDTQRDTAGRLLRSSRAGVASGLAMLADHAWLVLAMTRLYELDGDGSWLERAADVARAMIALFHDGPSATALDPEQGAGFFTTGSVAPVTLTRAKEVLDGALPSSTAVTITALARLGRLTGDADLEAIADRTLSLTSALLIDHPMAVPDLVLALGEVRNGIEVVTPGPPSELSGAAWSTFIPFGLRVHGSADQTPLLVERVSGVAYVCNGGTCRLPVTEPGSVVTEIDAAVRHR